ncbi:hypothetical protein HS1genome_1526 [Sulfodiicoccus acidiphilus]|uniref:Phosphate-starvation-inducible E-like protein n=1 Tax=Sulfodiicoccus acidiphilus TaxID=1670455 RepID=A0A348B4N5_9CREN|nr:phosphate-starvation-inducible PsiE family protein [Sulfodiicoccus acidiphilus]BBD73137.1 hypothetical protein HS1genome_1526 [Sulfodiicoccus acidiphilus]GGU00550.1 hypothetical protein GCM10007116_17230 [Sulfodiicoccus acidiphilus]
MRPKFTEEDLVRYVSYVIQALLMVGLVFVLGDTVFEVWRSLTLGPAAVVEATVDNALLAVVLLEILMSMIDFARGKGRSVVYVMDATLSFILREIIIEIFGRTFTVQDLAAYGALIAVISLGRFILVRSRKWEAPTP